MREEIRIERASEEDRALGANASELDGERPEIHGLNHDLAEIASRSEESAELKFRIDLARSEFSRGARRYLRSHGRSLS
jgi:hypothetical protein